MEIIKIKTITYDAIAKKSYQIACWLAMALGFAISVSTAISGILSALIIVLWLISGNFKEKYAAIRRNPVAVSAILISVLFFVGMLWGEVNKDTFANAARFLLIPLLIPLFLELKMRRYALWGFLSAMAITLILSYLAWLGLLPQNEILRRTKMPYDYASQLPVEALCEKVNADIGNAALTNAKNKPVTLNEILEMPDLYDRLKTKRGDTNYSRALMDLVKTTDGYRTGIKYTDLNGTQKEKIMDLNRMILEETYSFIIPKKQKRTPVNAAVIHSRITQNFFMAFAVFLLAVHAMYMRSRIGKFILCALIGLASYNILFIISGRTGHLVFLVLMFYFLLSWLKFRKGVLVSLVIVALFSGVMYFSPSNVLTRRVITTVNEYSQWNPEKADKTGGIRLEYYYNTLKIIRDNPLFGVGTGSFAKAYAEKVEGTDKDRTLNPHNEYLFVAAQLGLVGLAALLFLFYTQWRYSSALHDQKEKVMARGLVLAMMVGCLFNSFLKDYSEGMFYFWMSAVLFASLSNSMSLKEIAEN